VVILRQGTENFVDSVRLFDGKRIRPSQRKVVMEKIIHTAHELCYRKIINGDIKAADTLPVKDSPCELLQGRDWQLKMWKCTFQ